MARIVQAAMLGIMPCAPTDHKRLDQARELIREKGLSRQDIQLLEDILRAGGDDLFPMLDHGPAPDLQGAGALQSTRLRKSFGLFLAFLNPGDEVLVPDPYFPAYTSLALLA